MVNLWGRPGPLRVLAASDADMPAGVFHGAAGVVMGRSIFQSDDPVAMIRAVSAVVHESVKPQAAYDQFLRR